MLHHLGDLQGMDLAGGATHDREVLTREVHEPAADRGRAGDDPVGGDFLAPPSRTCFAR